MIADQAPTQQVLPRAGSVVVFAALAAGLAAALPLIAYAGSLALFALPHVLAELRYVDGRFGRRTPRSQVVTIGALLALAVTLRALSLFGIVDAMNAFVVELGLVAVMAFVVVPSLAASPVRAAAALLVGGALAAGSWMAPLATIVLLAALHNLTPVAFLIERLGAAYWWSLRGLGLVALFVGVPLLIASGLPAGLFAAWGLFDPSATFGSVGGLESHTVAFVPRGWFTEGRETQLFAAATYLQLMHYGAVLLVLPRLLATGADVASPAFDAPLLPWPRGRVLGALIATLGAVTACFFVAEFRGTRAAYGVLAALHAWIEIPVLLFSLSFVASASAASGSGRIDASPTGAARGARASA